MIPELDTSETARMRGDLKAAMDVLWEFAGRTVWQKAQAAVERIGYLTRAVNFAQHNENAAHAVIAQEQREINRLRTLLNQGGSYDEGKARQASGVARAQQERKEGSKPS